MTEGISIRFSFASYKSFLHAKAFRENFQNLDDHFDQPFLLP
jgi:hypothetical protein